jgi:predicted small metal-binding protein
MGFSLSCGDIVPGCEAKIQGETEEDVLRQGAAHAQAEHGIESMDAETIEKVKAAVRAD